MSNVNHTHYHRSDHKSLVNGFIDPALLTAHPKFGAGAGADSLNPHQRDMPCSNRPHDPYGSEAYRANTNIQAHGFDSSLDERYFSASLTNGPALPQSSPQRSSSLRPSESPSYYAFDSSPFNNHESLVGSDTTVATDFSYAANLVDPNPTSLANDGLGENESNRTNTSHRMRTRQPLLETFFEHHTPYPTPHQRGLLAQLLEREERYVRNWFNNKRARENKELSFFTTTENEYLSVTGPTEQLQLGRRGTWRSGEEALRPGTSHDLSITLSDDIQLEQWPCTFCLTLLKRKAWKRHMDSHVPPSWFCMPVGTPLDDDNICVFCGSQGGENTPGCNHFQISVCCRKDLNDRVFATKDKLRQHIRTVHLRARGNVSEQQAINIPQSWCIPKHVDSKLWCGICRIQFSGWEVTKEHIAQHFRMRDRLSEWRTWEAPDVGNS